MTSKNLNITDLAFKASFNETLELRLSEDSREWTRMFQR